MSKTRAAKSWRAPRLLLIAAFVVSLLVHFLSATGDLLYDYVVNGTSPDTHEKLRKATHKLSAQQWDDDAKRPDALKGIKRPEIMTVWFAPRQPSPKPVAIAVAKPAPHKTSVVVARRKPSVHIAQAVNAASAVEIASTVASTPASATASVTVASAPATTGNGQASVVATASSPVVAAPAVASAPRAIVVSTTFPQTVVIKYKTREYPIPARLKWAANGDRYSLTIGASLFGKSRTFTSEGRISKTGLAPERFTDTRDGKLQNEALFDWSSHQLVLHDGDKTIESALHDGDQDMFSAAFQFALQGALMKNFTFSLASGSKVYPNIAFEIMGEKTLQVSGQPVDAILLRGTFEDRVFDFWLAPQWSNLPVRMALIIGKKTYDIWATEIEIDNNTVLEEPVPGLARPRGPHG